MPLFPDLASLRELSLSVAPRFGAWPLAVKLPLYAVCLLPLGLTVLLYRYELRLVLPRAARRLLGLRLAVVAAVVAVVVLRPVMVRTTQEEVPGRVVVAFDRSASMRLTDPQRSIGEKLRLARALGLARDVCPDKLLDVVIAQIEPSGAMSMRIGSAGTSDEERRQFDAAVQRVDGLSRAQVAAAILQAGDVNLLGKLAAKHRVDGLSFASVAGELAKAGPLLPDAAVPSDAITDLRLPLAHGLARTGPSEEKTLAVVLLTDGQHNAAGSPVEKAQELGQAGVPVYAVPLGSSLSPSDIAVVSAHAPAQVFKGAELVVEARVQVNGLGPRQIAVELRRPGRAPVVEKFRHDGANQSYTVRLQTRLDEIGTQPLSVVAVPVLEETRTENNRRDFAVNVADDKARALLIDGEARWEYHYLASALARDPSMETKGVVFAQPRIERMTEAELAKVGNPALQLPAGDDALADFDCVVLGDVTPEQLPPADRARLEQFVGESGGTLVVIAGKRAMPARYLPDPADPLARLLPISDAKPVTPRDGFGVGLTAGGQSAGYLQLESTAEASDGRWMRFPPHFWALVGVAKPGATVLAVPRTEPASIPADERTAGLIVRHNYGFGRVLYVGLDSTWRWRFKQGDLYHHRFWGQVMRWAAADKPLVAGNDHLRFGTRQASVPQGQDIDVVARLTEATQRATPDALVGARVVRIVEGKPDEQVALAPLARGENRPRELSAKLRDLPPGQYAVELVAPALADKLDTRDGTGKLRALFGVTPPETTELVDVAANLPLLDDIAAKSGGRVIDAADAASLVELLMRQTATRTLRQETKLWESWWLFGVVVALVTAEWVGRKWAGLP